MAPPSVRVSHRISGLITASPLALAAIAAAAPVILPDENGTLHQVAAAAIFTASHAALAIGKVPGLPIGRAGIALVGACLMVACGAPPLEAAYQAIDLDTITLLPGTMIIVANLRLSGFLGVVTSCAASWGNHPALLLRAAAAMAVVIGLFFAGQPPAKAAIVVAGCCC